MSAQAHPRLVTLVREAKGWSQRELAEAAGLSQAFVSKIESGLADLQGRIWNLWRPRWNVCRSCSPTTPRSRAWKSRVCIIGADTRRSRRRPNAESKRSHI